MFASSLSECSTHCSTVPGISRNSDTVYKYGQAALETHIKPITATWIFSNRFDCKCRCKHTSYFKNEKHRVEAVKRFNNNKICDNIQFVIDENKCNNNKYFDLIDNIYCEDKTSYLDSDDAKPREFVDFSNLEDREKVAFCVYPDTLLSEENYLKILEIVLQIVKDS